jgi:RNA polymerase sigma-70 factor (ECF subfamily)
MTDREGTDVTEDFEVHREHLMAVALRILGSPSEADDALQEAWLRASRADTGEVANIGGWLTTVVGRVCLDMLRSRKARREEPLDGHDETLVSPDATPEADSLGPALSLVMETLTPAERVAFVLHDGFTVPFDEIAPIVGRTPAATRKLASRARARIQGAPTVSEPDLGLQRKVVEAFLAAAREGDFAALVKLLDPQVVARAGATLVRGAGAVAKQALAFSHHAGTARVEGTDRIVVAGTAITLAFTVRHGLITEIDIAHA